MSEPVRISIPLIGDDEEIQLISGLIYLINHFEHADIDKVRIIEYLQSRYQEKP